MAAATPNTGILPSNKSAVYVLRGPYLSHNGPTISRIKIVIATAAILILAIWSLVKLNSPIITGMSGAQANHAKKQTKNASHVIWKARIAGVEKLNNFISVAFLASIFMLEDMGFS